MYTMEKTRKKINVSQEDMGILFGMHQTGIARLESGEREETIIHKHLLAALLVLDRHDLISELVDMTSKIV